MQVLKIQKEKRKLKKQILAKYQSQKYVTIFVHDKMHHMIRKRNKL